MTSSDDPDNEANRDSEGDEESRPWYSRWPVVRIAGFVGGLVAFVVVMSIQVPGLEPRGRAAAAVTLWMAIWWITETIPVYATALVPVVAFPMTGVLEIGETTRNYGHELIFLFLGGFLVAVAIQKWDLHRRIALFIVDLFGTEPTRLVLGFMVATGFLSMWISNTAAAMMMVPIGLATISQLTGLIEESDRDIDTSPGEFPFGMALMLGIGYSASVGGVATIIGSPPNAIFVGYAADIHDVEITFFQWMIYGLPLSVVGMVVVWVYLTRIAHPIQLSGFGELTDVIERERQRLDRLEGPEARVLVVFGLVAALWILRGVLAPVLDDLGLGALNDTSIAIFGGLLLFVIPADLREREFLLEWDDAGDVPWGILVLFGGGLALANGIKESGLAEWLGDRLHALEAAPIAVVLVAVALLVVFLTEVTSNTATASILVPVVAVVGGAVGIHPWLLMVLVATAASYAFMLPIATPPNAVVFSSDYVSMRDMMRAGIWLNLGFVVVVAVVVYFWLPVAWGL